MNQINTSDQAGARQIKQSRTKKFHIAIAVSDLSQSITDYSKRLGCQPQIIIDNEYALWRTSSLNFSIRKTNEAVGTVRHVGWEDSEALAFTAEMDCNGIKWENFAEQHQLQEIRDTWPGVADNKSE